ncbi:RluA family pseudouridine synthase [Caldisericum exile]|uniref:Pseudouridine synthase n=1 Tax=Caldisericum exile (strain DSM 21853 / NBRC 104410 / AZM16c01) TaxID=511051 RepID=A0A7U6GFE8_CALEA|nr:RluA family pseudouridine synthase [Caldisericum exile]BAL81341.1 ribosomal large subunit pseudouridine synthase D [Caldisericum exile AZM16c01]
MENKFVVERTDRLDKVIEDKLPNLSRSYIQKLIKEGYVLVNGSIVEKPSHKVKVNDIVEVKEKEAEVLQVEKEDKPIKIVYEDEYLLIIDKEAGLTVHPVGSKTTNTLVNRLLYHIEDLSQIGGIIRPGIVHRLDRDTSGLMVVAKNDTAHRALSEMLKRHEIKRKYICLVKGNFKEKVGIINLPLKREQGTTRMRVSVMGKEAITHFKVLESIGPYTLLQVELETGRTHQIRVHMAHIGHPLVGDTIYGKRDKNINLERQFLHSYEISFKHPIIDKELRLVSELPCDLKKVLWELREKWKKK